MIKGSLIQLEITHVVQYTYQYFIIDIETLFLLAENIFLINVFDEKSTILIKQHLRTNDIRKHPKSSLPYLWA
jgi:hypothetical protein